MIMRESKELRELKSKVEFLEDKLKNVYHTLELVAEEKIEEAQASLEPHKGSTAYLLLENLIDKTAGYEKFPETTDSKTFLFLKIILDNIPFPVFIKDESGKYLMVNGHEADLFGLPENEVIGKHDSDLIDQPEEIAIIRNSDEEVLRTKKSIELPNQSFSLPNGKTYIFKTHKMAFMNPINGRLNIMGFSVDITDTVNLDKLMKVVTMCQNPYM
jgi:PAS domain S-box-containing protein